MKSGLLVAAVLFSLVSINASWALDGKTFPGKGSKEAWTKACKFLDQGVEIAKKDEGAALPKFEQAIAIYPYADCFYRNLGVSHEKKKSPDLVKAEAAYRKSTELDPKDWRNWNALAGNLGTQERYKECRDASVKAMSCNPPADKAVGIKKTIQSLNDYLATQK